MNNLHHSATAYPVRAPRSDPEAVAIWEVSKSLLPDPNVREGLFLFDAVGGQHPDCSFVLRVQAAHSGPIISRHLTKSADRSLQPFSFLSVPSTSASSSLSLARTELREGFRESIAPPQFNIRAAICLSEDAEQNPRSDAIKTQNLGDFLHLPIPIELTPAIRRELIAEALRGAHKDGTNTTKGKIFADRTKNGGEAHQLRILWERGTEGRISCHRHESVSLKACGNIPDPRYANDIDLALLAFRVVSTLSTATAK